MNNFESEVEKSVAYLGSVAAERALDADPYWPKWHSPWWHMLLLHEMGLTPLIPERTIAKYTTALNRIPLKLFPIQPEDMPPGIDPFRGTPCHCQLGNVYQVLAARGVDVDSDLPWIKPWFLKYQMADGGLNCDNDAYLVKDECPSSMVGTIAAFEAILLYTPRPWTPTEEAFLEKAAQFLIRRELRFGSSTKHNAAEQASAAFWTQLCFPRFYLYDVLRGLSALTHWADRTGKSLPRDTVQPVMTFMERTFADGFVFPSRRSYEGTRTLMQSASGEWLRGQEASTFPLLEGVSAIGEPNPYLTRQWRETKTRLEQLTYAD